MHEFSYKNGQLFCESVSIADIALKIGTPFYLYSKKTLLDHYKKLRDAFKQLKPLICFSMKANSNLAVCKTLVKAGSGLDIVSGGELYKALTVGVDPKKIVYASVGKTPSEIVQAIMTGILFFNVESLPELQMIDEISSTLRKKAQICLRINPDIDPKTHKFITTGKKENKFGMDFGTAYQIFRQRHLYRHADITGIHVHIGSQITQKGPFVKALTKVEKFINELRDEGVYLKYLNIGGGLGIIYKDEKPQTAKQFASSVVPILKRTGLKIILEPGRFIAGNSGVLVTKVVYVKDTKAKNFAIVDAGMNDLMRPSLYGAHHDILPVIKKANKKHMSYDVVGPICESGDFLAKNQKISMLEQGDLLACMSVGAYGFTMSSNYNSRPRVCEIMVDKKNYYTVRSRETYEDLVRREIMPEELG